MSVALLCDHASSHAPVKCSCVQPLPYHIRLLHTDCGCLVLWIHSMLVILNTGTHFDVELNINIIVHCVDFDVVLKMC